MSEGALIEALKAIAHPLRHRILCALRGAELNVGEIEDVTGIGQPTLSQQLGVLRKAELVETRKAAKLVYYRLAPEKMAMAAEAVGDMVETERAAAPQRAPSPGAANFARLSQPLTPP